MSEKMTDQFFNMRFVFCKNGKIKLLNIDQQKEINGMMADGWVHTTTFDVNIFFEYLANEAKDPLFELSQLKVRMK